MLRSTTADGWGVIEDYVRPGLYSLETSRNVSRTGAGGSTVFSWAPGGIGAPRPEARRPHGAVAGGGEPRDPGSRRGGGRRPHQLGMSTFALPVEIVEVTDFFPTVDPREQPFVVADPGRVRGILEPARAGAFLGARASFGLTGTVFRAI